MGNPDNCIQTFDVFVFLAENGAHHERLPRPVANTFISTALHRFPHRPGISSLFVDNDEFKNGKRLLNGLVVGEKMGLLSRAVFVARVGFSDVVVALTLLCFL